MRCLQALPTCRRGYECQRIGKGLKRCDKLTVRSVTIAERARWTAESILTDDEIEEDKNDCSRRV